MQAANAVLDNGRKKLTGEFYAEETADNTREGGC
jgi:hypothetical protein